MIYLIALLVIIVIFAIGLSSENTIVLCTFLAIGFAGSVILFAHFVRFLETEQKSSNEAAIMYEENRTAMFNAGCIITTFAGAYAEIAVYKCPDSPHATTENRYLRLHSILEKTK